jgi:hypothetical protein
VEGGEEEMKGRMGHEIRMWEGEQEGKRQGLRIRGYNYKRMRARVEPALLGMTEHEEREKALPKSWGFRAP